MMLVNPTIDTKSLSVAEQEEMILGSIGLTHETTDTLILALIGKLIQRAEHQWSTQILDEEFIICIVAIHGILDNYRALAWGNVDDILKALTDKIHASQLSRQHRRHVLSYISSSGRNALGRAYIEKYWKHQQSTDITASKKHTIQQKPIFSWPLDLIRLQVQSIREAQKFFQTDTLDNLRWGIHQKTKELISEKAE